MPGGRSARSSRSSGMSSSPRGWPCHTASRKSRSVLGVWFGWFHSLYGWRASVQRGCCHCIKSPTLCCPFFSPLGLPTPFILPNPFISPTSFHQVISRSGDECVVALTDQWYLTYGEEQWAATTTQALQAMRTFATDVQHGFEHTLGWLKQWACSRSFGLGTRLPWDPEYLIESLSDSTIYMAYYTVAHLLQNGDMYGRAAAPAVAAEDMTDAVWDHVLLGGPAPSDCRIAPEVLERMRREFDFWYPFDLRVSGKDLIQNHLTFCLYNHTAIWPERQWPKGMRCNGHLQLNGEKMSKSTGNFKTLKQAVQEYSADAMRVSLRAWDVSPPLFSSVIGTLLALKRKWVWCM